VYYPLVHSKTALLAGALYLCFLYDYSLTQHLPIDLC